MGADKYEKQRRQKIGRYVRFFHWMMSGVAWRSLSPVARCVYQQMAARYTG